MQEPAPAQTSVTPQGPPQGVASEHLSTACPGLDRLLSGGLERDAITLVFGAGGSGKTNLALQLAREVARRDLRTAYVDTEGVSAVRLGQVFGEVSSEQVLFFTPYSLEEQERLVQNAVRVPGLGLVVVDSLNMHYRLAIDGGDGVEPEAGRSLYRQLHLLSTFSRQNRVPVLVTGQVYGGEDATQPFGGRVMEHLVKAVVRFEKRESDGAGGLRKATLVKHRSMAEGRLCEFHIGSSGLGP
ncbi:MAG: ATPase domain-containing protein [Thermoplasmatota archaeon]